MQCNNDTWQQALERLLEMADVVVMDLSGLTAEDRGCAHEITRLFEVMPLAKVMFVIDDSTDRATLSEVFAIALQARTEESCNRDFRGPLEIYRAVPLPSTEQVQAPAFGRSVIESLRDRAIMMRPPRPQETQPRWTAPGVPRVVEYLGYGSVLVAILMVVGQILG